MGWLGLGPASLARRARRGTPPAISAAPVPVLGALANGDQVQSGLSAGALDAASYASTEGTIASVAPTVTIDGVPATLTDTVAAGDAVSVVITVADDAGNSRAFLAGAQIVAGVAPGLAASQSLSGRRLTITVDSLTGAPAPATALTALTLDGADVLGDQAGSGPWEYTAPDAAMAQTVAWTVSASNFEGIATVSASETIPANLFAPAPAAPPAISGSVAPGETVTLDAGGYAGTAPITVTVSLTLDGVDVTGDVVSGSYTIPPGAEGQSLVYTETARNGIAPDATQSASRTVQAAPAFPEATGGTETAITDPVSGDAYTAYTFTGDGTYQVLTGGEFEVLLVGPGGPGGSTFGYTACGGGSGGEVVLATLTLTPGTYPVTLGTSPAPSHTGPAPGTPTTALGLTARPGGRGSGFETSSPDIFHPARDGGGGGFARAETDPAALGAAHPAGFRGGDVPASAFAANGRAAAGGRGDGGDGEDAISGKAGDGGPGTQSGIGGTLETYGRGGGGGGFDAAGAPNGGVGAQAGGPGANPGDGGGGASADNSAITTLGGAGGPGLVIVRHRRAA